MALAPAILSALSLLTVDPLAPEVVAVVAAEPGYEALAVQLTLALLSVTPRDRVRLLSAPSRELQQARLAGVATPGAEELTDASFREATRWLSEQRALRTRGIPPLAFLVHVGALPRASGEWLDGAVTHVEECPGAAGFAVWLLLARHGLPAPRAALRLSGLEGPLLVQLSPDGPVLLTLPSALQPVSVALPPGNFQVIEAVGTFEGLLAQLSIREGQTATITGQSFNAAIVLGRGARALLQPPPPERPILLGVQLSLAPAEPAALGAILSLQRDLQPLRVGLQGEVRATWSARRSLALLPAAVLALHHLLDRVDLGLFALAGGRLGLSPERTVQPLLGGGAEALLALTSRGGVSLRLQVDRTFGGGGVKAEAAAGIFLRF